MSRLKWMEFFGAIICVGGMGILRPHADDGAVVLQLTNNTVMLKVDGDKDDDWWLQASTNLSSWTTLTNMSPVLSGNETNAPWRSAGGPVEAPTYYRAVQTAGLYDRSILRTISLSFSQANWSNLLVTARSTGVDVTSRMLTMDNGATNLNVGARFRGNTSFSGASPKKSIAISIDHSITNADLMGFNSLNCNNAFQDETIMRESVYFTMMRNYTVCPAACLVKLYINGGYRGVYSQNQQQNSDLIREYFPSTKGDRWRAANINQNCALVYLGNTNRSTYAAYYELKSETNVNAWPRLLNAIYVLNNTPTNVFRDKIEEVLAVDRWLWFLACENVFADDDSYWNKGADYILYYEPESGRLHPVEHDGNEAFVAGDVALSPLINLSTRPVIARLLAIPELRQRYFAHMRTVVTEWFNPTNAIALVNQFHSLSIDAIIADPFRGYANMTTYTNDLNVLKNFITNRWRYLTITNVDLRQPAPQINFVTGPTQSVYATDAPTITASVSGVSTSGLATVWLYFRDKPYGRFASRQMFDDGTHGDGAASDGVFGAVTTNYPAGNKIHYYVEARGTNQAARFAPPRAEQETFDYMVSLTGGSNTSVVINEFMADNSSTLADPQGEYDDWIELKNLTDSPVSLEGLYLTDNPVNPRKWAFPAGTVIPANGFLLVWADEDGTATPGLHANFKLSDSGEDILLIDTDANHNQVLDAITFGVQSANVSYGRSAANADEWGTMTPTPDAANQ